MALSPPLHLLSVQEKAAAVPGKWAGDWYWKRGLELKYSIDFLDVFLVRDPDIESKLFVSINLVYVRT